MPTIRGWWEQDRNLSARFYHEMLHHTDIDGVFARHFRNRKEKPGEPGGFERNGGLSPHPLGPRKRAVLDGTKFENYCENPPLLLAQEICYNTNDLNQKEGILLRRGICPRVSGGKKFSPLSFIGSCNMEAKRTLSMFVDESGRFQHPDPDSRFYIKS